MSEKQLVDIGRHRVPLKTILHGREIRDAMAELEKFRRRFNEQEFMLGGRVYLEYRDGECMATVKRLETDKEFAKRLELERAAAAAKAERKRQRELRAAEKERQRELKAAAEREQRRLEEIAQIRAMAEKHGLKVIDG